MPLERWICTMRCWINMFCHNDLHSNQKQPAQDGPCWLDSKVLKDQFGSTSTLPYITDMIQQFNDLPPFTSRFHLDLTPTTGHCYTNEMACVFYGPTLSAQPQSRWLIGTFRGGPNSNPTPGMPFKIQVTLLLYHRSVTTWLTSSVSHPRTLIQALSSPNRSLCSIQQLLRLQKQGSRK
jgi:hypothetical protein